MPPASMQFDPIEFASVLFAITLRARCETGQIMTIPRACTQ